MHLKFKIKKLKLNIFTNLIIIIINLIIIKLKRI